jgi:hypothetical protein
MAVSRLGRGQGTIPAMSAPLEHEPLSLTEREVSDA